MKSATRRQRGLWLAAAVTLLAVVSAVLLVARGIGSHAGRRELDSRVTCDKLGPKACDPSVAAAPARPPLSA